MQAHQAVPSLMFMTLGVVAVLVVALLLWHLRRRSNRHAMDDQPDKNIGKEIDEGRRGGG